MFIIVHFKNILHINSSNFVSVKLFNVSQNKHLQDRYLLVSKCLLKVNNEINSEVYLGRCQTSKMRRQFSAVSITPENVLGKKKLLPVFTKRYFDRYLKVS